MAAHSMRRGIFISYSHRDRKHLDRLQVHLRPLELGGLIDVWDDTRLMPGSQWKQELAMAIETAKAAILLISADFLASEFITENELPPLLKAAREDGGAILPVIVGACRFTRIPDLSMFQAANDPSRPVATLPVAERERVWVRVAESVEAILVNRGPEEGWLVANEKLALGFLRQLVMGNQQGGFSIFSVGNYYVQFLKNQSKSILYCEAVSNNYLPRKLHLTAESVQRLLSFGFQKPDDRRSNYHKVFDLEEAKRSLSSIAALAVRVMGEVYNVGVDVKLDCKIDLEDETGTD
jgi:hypothetical protein